MSSIRAPRALSFQRLDRAHLDAVLALQFEPRQITEFLAPLDGIVAEARTGLTHLLVGIETATGLIGFFVVHPDQRDRSCWWLAWFAIDRRFQGHGYGHAALVHAIDLLRRRECCHHVRLLVAHGNTQARHLYDTAGFRDIGRDEEGWHILDLAMPGSIPTAVQPLGLALQTTPAKRTRHRLRLRPSPGPYAARSIGTVRGPPGIDTGGRGCHQRSCASPFIDGSRASIRSPIVRISGSNLPAPATLRNSPPSPPHRTH